MYLQGSFILWAAQHQQMHNDITQLKHLGFNLLLKYDVKYLHQIDSSISMVSTMLWAAQQQQMHKVTCS